MNWQILEGDSVAISSPTRWPNGTSLYREGIVEELRAGGRVVVVRDSSGALHYAKRQLVRPIQKGGGC